MTVVLMHEMYSDDKKFLKKLKKFFHMGENEKT